MTVLPDLSGFQRILPEIPVDDPAWASTFLRILTAVKKRVSKQSIQGGGGFRYTPEKQLQVAVFTTDYSLWAGVPRKERPESWPKDQQEFADRVGVTRMTLITWAQRFKARFGKFITGAVKENAHALDQALFNAAMAELESGNVTQGARAAELWYKRHGLISLAPAVFAREATVNTGPQLSLTVNQQPGELDERLKRLVDEGRRYLERTKEAKDVEAIEVEVASEHEGEHGGADQAASGVGAAGSDGDRLSA